MSKGEHSHQAKSRTLWCVRLYRLQRNAIPLLMRQKQSVDSIGQNSNAHKKGVTFFFHNVATSIQQRLWGKDSGNEGGDIDQSSTSHEIKGMDVQLHICSSACFCTYYCSVHFRKFSALVISLYITEDNTCNLFHLGHIRLCWTEVCRGRLYNGMALI